MTRLGALLLLLATPLAAQFNTRGWTRLTNTAITNTALGGANNICPADGASGSVAQDNVSPYPYQSQCHEVIDAWNSGVARTKLGSESLYVWGGGHGDYGGNEVYKLDLRAIPPTMRRVTNPSQITSAVNGSGGQLTMPDGNPNIRHTYDGLVYLPNQDSMYVFGGQGPYPANPEPSQDTWWLNLSTLVWTRKDPVNNTGIDPFALATGHPGSYAGDNACSYDTVSNGVYCMDGFGTMYAYDPANNKYYGNVFSGGGDALTPSSVIDTKRHLYYQLSTGKANRVDITNGFASALTMTSIIGSIDSSCNTLVNAPGPGLAYDPVIDKIVGYPANSLNVIWLMDPVTYTCTSMTFPGGPPSSGVTSVGNYKRFSYFPTLDVFVVVNGFNEDAYVLNLTGVHGMGSYNSFCVDRDGDGYGTGPIKLGPFTDLVIDATNNLKVTSASHSFVTADVGRVITVTAGTNFNQAWYMIGSVSSGAAILKPPSGFPNAVGTVGSTGGSWVIYGCAGPDADDNDATVHLSADALTKWTNMAGLLNHLGYFPLRIWLIDPAGTSGASSCTPATFSSCLASPRSTAPTSILAGDMIMLRGNANVAINLSGLGVNGTQNNPIIVMGYPGETPVITAVGGIATSGMSWIIIDGIQGYGSSITGGDVTESDSPHTFHDNIFRHIYGGPDGFQGMGPMGGGDRILIEDSVFANNNYDSGQAGLYIGCTLSAPCTNWTVRRSIAYNNGYDGLHWNGRGTGITFTQNISHTNMITGLSFQSGMSNSTVTDNLSFNNASYGMLILQYKDNDASCGSPAPCGTGGSTGNLFENNTFSQLTTPFFLPGQYNNATDGCIAVANTTGEDASGLVPTFDMGNNTWRNNICMNYGDISSVFRYAPIYFVDSTITANNSKTYFKTSTFDHNLTKQMGGVNGGLGVFGVGPLAQGGQSAETIYDCTSGQALLTTGSITGCVVSDPLVVAAQQSYFFDPSQYNYNLTSSSPALHAGVSALAYDLLGRYTATPSPSIGAMELGCAIFPSSITPYTANQTVLTPTFVASGCNTSTFTTTGFSGSGLSVNATTGQVTGTAVVGSFAVTVSYDTANISFVLTVNPALVITTTSPLPGGTVGSLYSQTLAASGGTLPLTWALASGSNPLPPGTSLSANGAIAGTTSTAGTFTPTIQVTDANGVTVSQLFSITVTLSGVGGSVVSGNSVMSGVTVIH